MSAIHEVLHVVKFHDDMSLTDGSLNDESGYWLDLDGELVSNHSHH
jgi:hypothetical protein